MFSAGRGSLLPTGFRQSSLLSFGTWILSALVLLLLVQGSSLAVELDPQQEIVLNQGIMEYTLGNHSIALQNLQQLPSDHPVVQQYLGLCGKQLATETQNDPETKPFAVQPASHQQVQRDEASLLLSQENAPCDVCLTEPVCAPRPWHLTVLAAYQYDSNVTLSPEFSGLGGGSDIQDSSTVTAMFADYQVVQSADWNVGLVGSAFSTFYYEATNFDVQDYMGGAYTNIIIAPNTFLGVRYEYHDTKLDYGYFAGESRLVSSLNFLEGDFGHTTAYYEFDSTNFADAPLIPAMERDGQRNAVGVTQAIYTTNQQGRLFAGYRYETARTDGTDFDRDTHMVTGRIEQPLNPKWIADGEARFFWDDYLNPNSLDFLDRPRNDDRLEVRAGLQWYCRQHVSVRFDYTFINQTSNVANLFDVRFYDFDRHLFSSQLIYDF